jgi:hypothetical protein
LNSLFESLVQLFQQQPVAQTIGLLALFVGLSGFAQKNDQRLKIMLSFFCVIMGIHFMMMGSYPGAIAAWIGSARSWASSRTRSWQLMLVFMLITVALTVPKITSWILVLPLIGGLLGTWAMFRETGMRLRLFMLLGTFCWLTHNIAIGSIGGTMIETSFLMMNSLTVYRLWREKTELRQPEEAC